MWCIFSLGEDSGVDSGEDSGEDSSVEDSGMDSVVRILGWIPRCIQGAAPRFRHRALYLVLT